MKKWLVISALSVATGGAVAQKAASEVKLPASSQPNMPLDLRALHVATDPEASSIAASAAAREQRDLVAQESMAASAIAQQWLTGAALLASIFSLIFLRDSLKQTRKSLALADLAHNQTVSASESAAKLNRTQSCAYVLLDGIVFGPPNSITGSQLLHVNIRNFGLTPATDVRVRAAVWYPEGEVGSVSPTDELVQEHGHDLYIGVLGPQQQFQTKMNFQEERKLPDRMFIFGWIVYDDLYGDSYIARFSVRYDPIESPWNTFVILPDYSGIGVTPGGIAKLRPDVRG